MRIAIVIPRGISALVQGIKQTGVVPENFLPLFATDLAFVLVWVLTSQKQHPSLMRHGVVSRR